MSERVRTGIKTLDDFLEGGFLKKQVILLAGNPGTGKTTFGTQFLYEGLKNGEPGIFVGIVEPKEDYMSYMKSLGFDLEKFERKGMFTFIEALTVKQPYLTDVFIDVLLKAIRETNAKRVVIDSITAISLALNDQKEVRSFIHNTLVRALKMMGVTGIVIADLPYNVDVIGYGVEEFVLDGVIVLKKEMHRGVPRRRLYIEKMRGSKIHSIRFDFIIDSGGIVLIPPFGLSPSGKIGERKVPFGIAELDALLDGGLRSGTSTMLLGPSGSGKTIISLKFALTGALFKESVLYISFEESVEQLQGYLKKMCAQEDVFGTIKVFSQTPLSLSPYELIFDIKKLIENNNPERVVLDGATALRNIYSSDDFSEFIRYLCFWCKSKNITLLVTKIGEPFKEDGSLSTAFDNIIGLWLYKEGDKLIRKIGTLKARGTLVKSDLKSLDFRESGQIIISD
ncbi:MAG: AAA family ATPase [Candidatus Methanomethyliaceae archaeon]|nr:AAA family ATPase [Candidatus Methanomethyliaceae archaeon]